MNEDLSQQLQRLLERINAPESPSPPKTRGERLWIWLNSTFAITVVGGLVVGGLSMLLQAEIAQVREDLSRKQELRGTQIEVMTQFADGMARWLGGSQGVIKRAIWLRQYQSDTNRVYPDRRSYAETSEVYERTRAELDKLPQPDALCARAKAVYGTSRVYAEVDRLIAMLNAYQHATNRDTYTSALALTEEQYQYIVELMGKELWHE